MWFSALRARPIRHPRSTGAERMNQLTPRADDGDGVCLPARVTATAPDCAIPCLQAFIARSFNSPSCRLSSNLDFLCTTVSRSGLTLGEGGFQCVLQSCGPQSDTSIYNVCGSIEGAQPKTWATITATRTPSQTTGTNAQTTITSLPPTSSTASPTTTPPDLGSLGYTTANEPFPRPTATPISSQGTNTGQAVGIAVGSVAGVVGLLGIVFFFCRRRRKGVKKRASLGSRGLSQTSSSFSSAQVSMNPTSPPEKGDGLRLPGRTLSPIESIAAAVEAAQAGITIPVTGTAMTSDVISSPAMKMQKPRSFMRKSIPPEDIGLAVSPKEGANFVKKASGAITTQDANSMMPIPESSVLPGVLSPTTTTRTTSEQIGERMSHINSVNATAKTRKQKRLSNNFYSQEKQVVTDDTSSVGGDGEAQVSPPPPPSRTSLLSSARASLTGLGAVIANTVSLNRQPSDSKPLLKSAPIRSHPAQPTTNYPMTPKYDNGYFDPTASLPASSTSQPLIAKGPPNPSFKIARKPTFSSFVAGKLLPPPYRSVLANNTNDQIPPVPRMYTGMTYIPADQSRAHPPGTSASYDKSVGQRSIDNTFIVTRDSSDIRSPGMIPAPLTIRKSRSSKTVGSATTADTLGRNVKPPPHPPLPALFYQATAMNTGSIIPVAPRKVLELMGLGSPTNVHEYAQKPLPRPNPTPNPFANLAPALESSSSRPIDSAPVAKRDPRTQVESTQPRDEIPDVSPSVTSSWLSVPGASPRATAPETLVQTPSSQSEPASSIRSPLSASPRGNPGFPSMAPSLSSIYTKYKYSRSQLPLITPTSAITLSAATYNPPSRRSRSIAPGTGAASQTSFLRDPSPVPDAGPAPNPSHISAVTRSEKTSSDILSNISSPQRFTRSINPYNPYFTSSPARQSSTASSRSQSVALSSHPTTAVPQFAIISDSIHSDTLLPAITYQGPSHANNQEHLGSRHTSDFLSPDSAEPGRESLGLVPKVVVTPNRTPGGDLVLTVDTTGKGYGL